MSNTPRRSATLKLDGSLRICSSACGGGTWGDGSPVLAYGQVNEQGGFRCKSELAGITCTVILAGQKSVGKGFRINRSGSIVRVG